MDNIIPSLKYNIIHSLVAESLKYRFKVKINVRFGS